MPGPPPPPPPGPPPPPAFSPFSGAGGGADDRGALLKSIRQGAKLKKTVTNDKSAPIIPGKELNNSSSAGPIGGKNSAGSAPSPMPNGMNLGGLFAGGMPKLKATGLPGASTLKLTNSTNSGTSNDQEPDRTPSPKMATSRNFNSVQDQLKKQLHNPSDTRTRGPPPPAPVRNISVDDSRTAKPFTLPSNQVSNGLHSSQTSLQANVSSLHANSSTLHRKSKSNANLNAFDCTDNINNGGLPQQQMNKPVINHGKPNLAPKPPILNGKPAHPTKLAVKPNKCISRAQSMRSPRSPSPQSPTPNSNANLKFGTVRHLSSAIGQSLTNLNSQNTVGPRQRPPLTARPSVPPPSVPPPAAPSVKMAPVKPPSHAPPPPPVLPQPPSHAPPPPPPHKTLQPSRPSPDIPSSNSSNASNNNGSNPPPPPPRFSSMRDVNQPPSRRATVDLEEKFRAAFSTPDRFPRPPPYRNVLKLYSNKQAASSKQPAPLPPQLQLHSGNKTWSPTSTC